jgi:hydrogenase nickel incorporation protein HypA/HybF
MHELNLATSIFEIVRQHAAGPDSGRVRAVSVRVGDMAGVLADSLAFCFRAIVAGTPYSGAFLAIDRVAARGRCPTCAREFPLEIPMCRCPDCGGAATLIAGDELQVVELELDDPPGAAR